MGSTLHRGQALQPNPFYIHRPNSWKYICLYSLNTHTQSLHLLQAYEAIFVMYGTYEPSCPFFALLWGTRVMLSKMAKNTAKKALGSYVSRVPNLSFGGHTKRKQRSPLVCLMHAPTTFLASPVVASLGFHTCPPHA